MRDDFNAGSMAGQMVKSASSVSARDKDMVDDGSGKTEVWRIESFDKAPVDPKAFGQSRDSNHAHAVPMHRPCARLSVAGQFFGGDSYIVRYTYIVNKKECYIIYFWQGSQSSQDEKGTSALLAKQMDDDLGGAATQVRVVMGKEPLHFIRCFGGNMVVHSGGRASGFKNKVGPPTPLHRDRVGPPTP